MTATFDHDDDDDVGGSDEASVEVLLVDLPGHGRTPERTTENQWDLHAAELLRALPEVLGGGDDRLDRSQVESGVPLVGVGHSMGGAILLAMEALSPTTFDRIVAVEPIVFPPEYKGMPSVLSTFSLSPPLSLPDPSNTYLDATPQINPKGTPPLAASAARRRADFPSRAAVRERYSGRLPFSAWDPAVFDAYLNYGFVDDPETGGTGQRHHTSVLGGWIIVGRSVTRPHGLSEP